MKFYAILVACFIAVGTFAQSSTYSGSAGQSGQSTYQSSVGTNTTQRGEKKGWFKRHKTTPGSTSTEATSGQNSVGTSGDVGATGNGSGITGNGSHTNAVGGSAIGGAGQSGTSTGAYDSTGTNRFGAHRSYDRSLNSTNSIGSPGQSGTSTGTNSDRGNNSVTPSDHGIDTTPRSGPGTNPGK